MLKLTPTWCGPLTTPGVLNLTPEFLQCEERLNVLRFLIPLLSVPENLLLDTSSVDNFEIAFKTVPFRFKVQFPQ